jgi:hypothetical protein
MKPFLFLDVDGVLNTFVSLRKGDELDDLCCRQLRRIIAETGCEVVLSSTWRLYPPLAKRVFRVVGRRCEATPEMRGNCRGAEIDTFLIDHPGRGYVIVDDDDDMLEKQLPHFVQTNGVDGGLTEEKATEIISKLKALEGID